MLVSLFRRVRSVIVLCGTVTVLLYYTFENEVNTLNSFAENESLPQIHKQGPPAVPEALAAAGWQGADAVAPKQVNPDTQELDEPLRNPTVLVEKNKYFPILHTLSDLSLYSGEEFQALDSETHKLYYPVRYESPFENTFSLKPKLSLPHIQAQAFSSDSEPEAHQRILDEIKEQFMDSWRAYYRLAIGSDELKPLSRYPTSSGLSRATTLLESLDMLYMLNQTEEIKISLSYIKQLDFSTSQEPLVDLAQNVERILGSLISAYELSGHKDSILLEKAVELADLLLTGFDTPNRIPLLKFAWNSKLRNRFPLQDSNLGQLGSLSLEFSRLSQLTKDEKYTRAIEHIYSVAWDSADEFDIEFLFPTTLDASGCVLLPKEQVDSGEHAKVSKVMKSIQKGKYVHCLQTNKFRPISEARNFYSADFRSLAFYSNMAKFYQLLNGFDPTSDSRFTRLLVNSFDRIKELMVFTPALPNPGLKNLAFVNSLATESHYDALTNEKVIKIIPDFTMHHSSCALGSAFALMGKLFDEEKYIELGARITRGCSHTYQLLGVMPESLHVGRCMQAPCSFDPSQPPSNKNVATKADSFLGVKVQDSDSAGDSTEKPSRAYIISEREEASDPSRLTAQWFEGPELPEYIDGAVPNYNLSAETIESIFYLYRITGEDEWRQMGLELWESTIKVIKSSGAKGVGQVSAIDNIFKKEALDALPADWFSKHLKFFYLLFWKSDSFSLDDYVFTHGGHLLQKIPIQEYSRADKGTKPVGNVLERLNLQKDDTTS
ncbi:LAQU0S06e04874g1_1 [Lachancea quebecensis]|uniref:alpha-1,2-Mannosidase n=1 Tax=Lachancea quebecensis TaxID=1654605 RepID=A0A0P1KRF3_9SACH|nr:LAQU0S06e04874g1_1 [Lachancea quebecensis]